MTPPEWVERARRAWRRASDFVTSEANRPLVVAFVGGAFTAGVVAVAGARLGPADGALAAGSGRRGGRSRRPKTITVELRENETLGDLVVRYVGDYTDTNVNRVLRLNKDIKDPGLLQPGQRIRHAAPPPLLARGTRPPDPPL